MGQDGSYFAFFGPEWTLVLAAVLVLCGHFLRLRPFRSMPLGWLVLISLLVSALLTSALLLSFGGTVQNLRAVGVIVCVSSMFIGHLMALRERDAKRLLFSSGVGNVGMLLLPLSYAWGTVEGNSFSAEWFYFAALILIHIGLIAAIVLIARTVGHTLLKGFSGLYYRAPWMSAAVAVLLLSLAAMPFTGGFLGKWLVLLDIVQAGSYTSAALVIFVSALSSFYCFRLLWFMYMRSGGESQFVHGNKLLQIILWSCAFLTVIMGICPGIFLK